MDVHFSNLREENIMLTSVITATVQTDIQYILIPLSTRNVVITDNT